MAAVADGVFLPFELVQDDGLVVRVVLCEPLTAAEEAEWVGCTRHRLRIPDGRLLVMGGGTEYFTGEDMEEFMRILDVPPGDYLAKVYTHLHGVNGEYCLAEAGTPEPLGAYFRRTRPGEPFPWWLRARCIDDPRVDPGHEAEWDDAEAEEIDDRPAFVDFLLRLSPYRGEAGPEPTEEGWFEAGAGARRPAVCPMGLQADLPVEDEEEDDEA